MCLVGSALTLNSSKVTATLPPAATTSHSQSASFGYPDGYPGEVTTDPEGVANSRVSQGGET